MQFHLHSIVPTFFQSSQAGASQVWRQDIHFLRGERIHLVAPSGSGKTSLIHFLYGLRKEYNGQIHFDKTDIRTFDPEALAAWRQQHVSIVFQDLRLFTDQPVYRNIEIKRALGPFHAQPRIQAMAEQLGVAHKLDSLCSTCSYGEQQRIAIIRSLQQPFDFLLLDEPFSHLDENNRAKAMELMETEARERGAAIILADLRQIPYFKADRILYV